MEQFITFASNNGLLSAVWVALVVMIIVITIRIQLSPIKQISTQELTFLMNREQGVALDIRKEKEFNTSHILDKKQKNKKQTLVGCFSITSFFIGI